MASKPPGSLKDTCFDDGRVDGVWSGEEWGGKWEYVMSEFSCGVEKVVCRESCAREIACAGRGRVVFVAGSSSGLESVSLMLGR